MKYPMSMVVHIETGEVVFRGLREQCAIWMERYGSRAKEYEILDE